MLTVSPPTVPPPRPVILDTHGNILGPVAGPYTEGEELNLHCKVTGGKQNRLVSWRRVQKAYHWSALNDERYSINPICVV
jgi:hypothetical protein